MRSIALLPLLALLMAGCAPLGFGNGMTVAERSEALERTIGAKPGIASLSDVQDAAEAEVIGQGPRIASAQGWDSMSVSGSSTECGARTVRDGFKRVCIDGTAVVDERAIWWTCWIDYDQVGEIAILRDPLDDCWERGDRLVSLPDEEAVVVPLEPTVTPVQECGYEVKPGDGWIRIARSLGVDLDELYAVNDANADTPIHPGQCVNVPQG